MCCFICVLDQGASEVTVQAAARGHMAKQRAVEQSGKQAARRGRKPANTRGGGLQLRRR